MGAAPPFSLGILAVIALGGCDLSPLEVFDAGSATTREAGLADATPLDSSPIEVGVSDAIPPADDGGSSADGGVVDDAGPAPDADAAAMAAISFPYPPSNFTPQQGPIDVDFVVTSSACAFDSSALAFSGTGCGSALPIAEPLVSASQIAAVLRMRSLRVQPRARLTLRGFRPVIMAVHGDATIEGEIDAGARAQENGAGASEFVCGAGRGGTGLDSIDAGAGGGGGGGYGALAGPGGAGGVAQGGPPGTDNGSPAITPLRGGCRGGPGGGSLDERGGGEGGGAGGALQLSAAGEVTIQGLIHAGGGGGRGGGMRGGGGGGGSGGAILIEGASVTVAASARISSLGGGGGEGADADEFSAIIGAGGLDADPMFAIPAGGGGLTPTGGDGGDGATASQPAQSGLPGSLKDAGGGGGGGGPGRIRINTSSCPVTLEGTIEPPPTFNLPCP